MRKVTRYFIFAVFALFSLPVGGETTLSRPDLLKVTFFNVRQGDAILIQTPDNKVILIDGGPRTTPYSSFDGGKDVIVPFLRKHGIEKIDMIVATHPDYDHIGGLIAVLKSQVQVEKIMVTGIPHTSKTHELFLQAIKDRNIPLTVPEKGEILNWGDKVSAQVIAPQVPPSRRLHRNLNNNSIVIRMVYDDISFLFTGDCEHEQEGEILPSGVRVKSTIYKVSHHGSRTGSGADFYYLIDPEAVVISAGKRNKFDHPHWEPIKLFRETGARIYRTDYSGTITIATDGKTYERIFY